MAHGNAHGDFHKTGVAHLAGDGEDLGARGLFRAVLTEGRGTVGDDAGDVGKGFHVVENRGLFPQTLLGGEGRTHAGHASLAFDGAHEGGFFTAHEGAGALLDLQMEAEVRAENVVADEAEGFGFGKGDAEALDGKRIFGAHVHVAFGGSGGPCADEHAFDHGVGIAFKDGSVHERAGIAFVGVAEHVLGFGLFGSHELPLEAGGEACAAAAAQARGVHFFQRGFAAHADGLGNALIAAVGDVFKNVFRVDAAAVAQHEALLQVVEEHVAVAVARGLAGTALIVQAFHGLAFEHGGLHELFGVLGLHAHVEDAAGIEDDERSEFAEAVAAGDHDAHSVVQAVVVDGLLQGVADVHAARGGAARAAADENLIFLFVVRALVMTQTEQGRGFFLESVEGVDGSESFEFKHVVLSFMPGSCREYRECRRGSVGRAYGR